MKTPYSKIIFLGFLHLWAFFFGVTTVFAYSISSFKWGGTSASYYINSTFASSFLTAMQAADASWDAAGSKFRFNYAGTTTRNPNVWAYSTDGYH